MELIELKTAPGKMTTQQVKAGRKIMCELNLVLDRPK